VLVLNNSKVFPARLIGKKAETGGKIEVFLLGRVKNNNWTCLLGGRGGKVNLKIKFDKILEAKVIKNNFNGTWELKFNKKEKEMMKIVEKIGLVPLPPYIKRVSRLKRDVLNYQTIYADAKKIGSVAAPTAGFHFTPELLKKIKKKGAQIEFITLHVGMGTFAPVKTENIKEHKMHSELVEIKKDVAQKILEAKREGRRIIAVGTTSTRALEGCLIKYLNKSSNKIQNHKPCPSAGWSEIKNFIYPGYHFKIIDALITNFHLPKSTLLMLVSAFAGKSKTDKAYKEAIKKKYRFFSYGDAMFIY